MIESVSRPRNERLNRSQMCIGLDFMRAYAFSQIMRLNSFQIDSLAKRIINHLEEKKLITFRESKDKSLRRAIEIIAEDFEDERKLEDEVNAKLDELEKNPTEGFERHRMFKMLKRKMADERGIIL